MDQQINTLCRAILLDFRFTFYDIFYSFSLFAPTNKFSSNDFQVIIKEGGIYYLNNSREIELFPSLRVTLGEEKVKADSEDLGLEG